LTDPVADASANITWTLGGINSESTFSEYYAYEIGSAIQTTFFLTATYQQTFSSGSAISGSSLFRYQIAALDNIPTCVSTDYETFTMPVNTEQCYYGKAVQYTRKREFSVCQINETIAHAPSVVLSTCACNTQGDYYCGLCAEKNASNPLQCVQNGPVSRASFVFCRSFVPSNMPMLLQTQRDSPCPAYTWYEYALNLGDVCTVVQQGIENFTTYQSISGCASADGTTGAIVGGILGGMFACLLIIGLVTNFAVFWGKHGEQIEETIEEKIENVVEEAKDAIATEGDVERI
jgi:hypothetical protein